MSTNLQLTEQQIREYGDLAYLGLGKDLLYKKYENPFDGDTHEMYSDPYRYFVKYFMDIDNVWWLCKIIFNVNLLPYQVVIMQELWNHKFPMLIGSRGLGKSFLLSLYCMVKALLSPGCKIVVAGAGLRQSLLLFDYCSKIWDSSPMLQNIATQGGQKSGQGPKKGNDRCSIFLGESSIVFIPIGSGEKIRGLRSNVTVVDEFASQNEDIFERVIGGFGVVTQDPIKSVREAARKDFLKDIHLTELIEEEDNSMGNQTIIAGTAYYDFNHFSRYWKRWKAIIETKGNKRAIKELCGTEDIPEYLDYRDYCVIRIPVELLPKGYMDEAQIARAKATIHNGIFQMEYGAIFTRDSEGFFRRTLIESCVASDNKPVRLVTGPVTFNAICRGNVSRKYIYGVDPAALQDNFAIVILELCGNHRRIVYCWTTNKSRHRELLKKNQTIGEMDYYAYCARKLRELMKTFPCERLGMDAQGGGIAIEEALQDTLRMMTGEQRILRTIEDDKPKPTDDEHGLHILDMVQFASNDWVREANHGMRMDFENKALLFPHFDPAMLEGASLIDEFSDGRVYDSLEEVMTNIEELKDELASIVYTQTTNGTDRWDTPEVKMPGNKKGRLRKDRYSALLIANMVARQFEKQRAGFTYDEGRVITDKTNKVFEVGPAWYMEGMKNSAIYNQ